MEAPDKSEWMGDLMARESHRVHPITSLKIPGTHNSFTNNLYPDLGIGPDRHRVLKWLCARGLGCIVKPLVFKWCQCQSLDATQQLGEGVRYFDFRLGMYQPNSRRRQATHNTSSVNPSPNHKQLTSGGRDRIRGSPDSVGGRQMRTLHALFGDPIGPILADINAFLDSHTKEVVILDFQHVFEFKCNDHEALVDKLFKTFGDKLCPIREDVSQLSIEQMAHTNKRVIVIYPSMAKVHNTLWPRYLCPNPWPNTCNRQELLRFLNEGLAKRNPCRLHVSQAIFTPTKATVARHLFSSLRSSVAKRCDSAVSKWLQEQESTTTTLTNIVIVDFMQFDRISDTVIELNNNSPTTAARPRQR